MEIKKCKTIEVVKMLSNMLSMQDGESKLETIVLSNMHFCRQAMDFLTFTFGYNNKLHIYNNHDYYLSFT